MNTPSLTKTITTADEQNTTFSANASASFIGSDQWACSANATGGSGNYSYIWSSSIFGSFTPSRSAKGPTFTAANYNGNSFDLTVTISDNDTNKTATDSVTAG